MKSPYSTHFDIDAATTYLTTPGSGLLSRETKQWRTQRDQDFHESNTNLREQQGAALDSCRTTLGQFFNCPTAVGQ